MYVNFYIRFHKYMYSQNEKLNFKLDTVQNYQIVIMPIAEDPSFRGLDQGVVKEAYAALVTLVSEASKHDLDIATIGFDLLCF